MTPSLIQQKMNQFLSWDVSTRPLYFRLAVFCGKISLATYRDLTDGQLSLRAMSLVYTTLITLVPLLALSFSVLKGFGVHNEIEPWLSNYLQPLGEKSQDVTERIITFVDNIEVGVLGAAGLMLLIYSVIALMQKIEGSFNFIWRVNKSRSIVRRFSDYLSVLVFGPCLLFLSAGLTSAIRSHGFFGVFDIASQMPYSSSLFAIVAIFIPYIIMALGFCFFYIYMPNTKVSLKAAFLGGLFTALVWKLMGWGFSNVIAASGTYVAIYAAFAALIILMVWMYLSWLMILMGANIAFYVQNPKYMRYARKQIILSSNMRLMLGLSIMEHIGKNHYHDDKAPTAEAIAKTLSMPVMAVQNMLDALEDKGLLVVSIDKKDERFGGYYPGKPLDKIKMADVVNALETYADDKGPTLKQLDIPNNTTAYMEQLENTRTDLLNKTVKDALLNTPT